MPKRGRRRKKTRTHVVENENAASALESAKDLKIPRSLVIRRGKVESEVIELVADLRKMMLPYTAASFKEDAKNRKMTLSHYAKELTGAMGVTHLMAISQNSSRLNLRLARTPSGPTLTFRLKQFSLIKQVRSVQRRPFDSPAAYNHAPIVVTNNFGDATAAPHVKLMRITFQNMFPAVNVATVKLADCRRVVLFNFMRRDVDDQDKKQKAGGDKNDPDYDEEEDEEVEVRHYAIKATPVGVNRKVRRIIQAKIPNLSKLDDVADYISGQTTSGAPAPAATSGGMSDSEAEDETSHVVLAQKYTGRGNAASQKSALKLVELGPRLRLKLTKVERGLAAGDVMYHAYIKKSASEVKKQRAKIEREALEKKRRREEQEANVERKKREKEEKREAKKQRKEEREKAAMEELRRGGGGDFDDEDDESESESGGSDGEEQEEQSDQSDDYSSDE